MEELKVGEKLEFVKPSLRTKMCEGCYYNSGDGCPRGRSILCVRSWSGSHSNHNDAIFKEVEE